MRLLASQSWLVGDGSSNVSLTVAGSVSDGAGSYGIEKSGVGRLALSGSNTFDGAFSISAGSVRILHGSALGSVSAGTDLASNAWLEVSGGITVAETLTLRDAQSAGALQSTEGTNVWCGGIELAGPSRVRASAFSRIALSGGVSGPYDLLLSPDAEAEIAVCAQPVSLPGRKIVAHGAGLLSLGASGHAFATLEVAGPGMRVRMEAPNVLPPTVVLSLGASYSPQGIVDLNGFDQTVSRLVRGTTSTSTNRIVTSFAPATLTVNETSTSPIIYYNGYLTGRLGLTKNEAGYLSLTGTGNTFTGATTVKGGTLEVGAASRLGFSSKIVVTGGLLRLLNATALADHSAVYISSPGKIHLQAGEDTVSSLFLNGKRQRRGTYGSTSSGATYRSDVYFNAAGTGTLSVLHGPECIVLVR
jgi:autotransporter-associated beta strand protein